MFANRPLIAMLSLIALAASPALAADAAPALPAAEADAKARVGKSPRHGEYVDIAVAGGKPVVGYVVYPERKDKAPVVIVIHEIFGLSDWVKGVADQLAAEGFIAVAPDLITGLGKDGKGTDGFDARDDVVKAVRTLKPEVVKGQLDAVLAYGNKLPSASGKAATIGFCWGGGQSFAYAVAQPELSAAVVYYGTNPAPEQLASLKVPVAGFYGGSDARVNATVPAAQEAVKKANGQYAANTFEGAGHGFLRQQDGQNGANKKATEQAWPATVAFLREHAEAKAATGAK